MTLRLILRDETGVSVSIFLSGDGYPISDPDICYLDPGILFPMVPKAELSVSADEVVVAQLLSEMRHAKIDEALGTFSLADLGRRDDFPGISLLRYVKEPYVILPNNEHG